MFKLQKGMPGLQKGMAHNGFRLQKGMSGCISARGCMHLLHHSCMHLLMPWMCIIDAQRPPLCRRDFSIVYNSLGFCNICVAFLQVWVAQWACLLMENISKMQGIVMHKLQNGKTYDNALSAKRQGVTFGNILIQRLGAAANTFEIHKCDFLCTGLERHQLEAICS